jgi:hypothetical protein
MAAYSHFLGLTVRVQYRLGDIQLSASGVFVADSGRSIFVEQEIEQRGKRNQLRWEIPYAYVSRIEELHETKNGERTAAKLSADAKAAQTAAETPGYDVLTIPSVRPQRS